MNLSKTTKGVIAFLVGWVGSYLIVTKVFSSEWNNLAYLFVGIVLAGIFSGAYSDEVKDNQKDKDIDG